MEHCMLNYRNKRILNHVSWRACSCVLEATNTQLLPSYRYDYLIIFITMCWHQFFTSETQIIILCMICSGSVFRETNLSLGVPIFSSFGLLCFGCPLQMTQHLITNKVELFSQHTIITCFRMMYQNI